jgi:hypothetical protein
VSHLGERIVSGSAAAPPGGCASPSRASRGARTAAAWRGRAACRAPTRSWSSTATYCEVDLARLRRVALGGGSRTSCCANPAHHHGRLTLDAGRIGNAAAPRYTYAGIAVIAPALFAGVEAGSKAQLAPLLRAAAERRLVGGELFAGTWLDVGTVERLSALEAYLAAKYARG